MNTSFQFIGESEEIVKVKKLISRFAKHDADVLIEGETGTGKEIVAANLYWQSPRAGKPYISLNTSSIQESLEISELFGHRKGSFTGADTDKIGVFEKADTGVLFLDEIADLNLSAQARILRAIEQNEIQILGGDTKKIDSGFIFASNVNLQSLVQNKSFRKDLYFRIARNKIVIPPLRERGNDIILLVKYFFKRKNKSTIIDINYSKLKKILLDYNWSGNVRELKGFLENLLIKYDYIDNSVIQNEMKNLENIFVDGYNEFEKINYLMEMDNFDEATSDFQKTYLEEHLRRNKYRLQLTCQNIGIERTRLYRLMKKFNIQLQDL